MTFVPTVTWAQRKDKVFLTVDLQDSKDVKVSFGNKDDDKAGIVDFQGKANEGKEYAVSLKLYDVINVESSKHTIQPRGVFIVVEKSEAGDHWP